MIKDETMLNDLAEQTDRDDTQGESLIIKGGTMGKDRVEIKEIPINKIKLARNSRMKHSDEELAGLMGSIKQQGLLQPIGVVKQGSNYEIIYGNRRFLALSKLGKTKIPAIIHEDLGQATSDLKNLTENIQRRSISLIEAGRYMDLLNKQGLSNAEIGMRLGVTRSYVTASLEAYQEVPKEFRNDIAVKVGGNDRKKEPGKISIRTVGKIIHAARKSSAPAEMKRELFRLAKSKDDFIPENALKYAVAIERGAKDPIKEVGHSVRVHVNFWMSEEERSALYDKHVTNGPFKSLNSFFIAVLKGEKSFRAKSVKA